MTDERRTVDRRWILGTIGAGTALGLAGCLGDDDAGGQDSGGEDESTDDGTDDAESGSDSGGDEDDGEDESPAIDEPVEFPEGEECAVCEMVAAMHPDWNAQLVHEDEERAFFCTTGCLTAYYHTPETFDGSDAAIANVWATDFGTGDLVSMDEGYLVHERDRERHDFPMPMGSPIAFGEEDDALAYVDEYDDLGEGDLFELADIDEDLALFYRKGALEAAGYEVDGADSLAIEPTDFPSDAECPVCEMMSAMHEEWNAQVLHEDEERAYFCSTGCMTAYYVDQEHFGGPEASIAGVWVTEYGTTELIDGTEASYVLVTDPDHVDDVMMRNPTPFADREDALAFADEFEEYDEEDVVGIDAFDRDLATLYRGDHFE